MTAAAEMRYEDFAPYFRVEGGNLIRLHKTTRTPANHVCGSLTSEGYLRLNFKGCQYGVHRIVYLLTHKTCPIMVDHINGNRADNRPENLRAADHNKNSQNRKTTRTTTGVKGVHCLKNGGGYQAYIRANGRRTNLGTYKTLEEAAKIVSIEREKQHGEFANYGVTK